MNDTEPKAADTTEGGAKSYPGNLIEDCAAAMRPPMRSIDDLFNEMFGAKPVGTNDA